MNTLIVYYSFTGNNRILAQHLAARIKADMHEITELKHRTWGTILFDQLLGRRPRIQQATLPWDRYGRVILIAPVWNARVASPMCTFVRKERANLKSYSVLTVCGGREGQQDNIRKQLTKLAGRPPLTITQLPINDRLPEERRKGRGNMGIVKITPDDLKYFQENLLKFIETLETKNQPIIL